MTDGVFKEAAPAVETPITPVVDNSAFEARLQAKDTFIAQLERENAEMRAEVAQAAQVEQLLREAREKAANPAPAPEAKPASAGPANPLNEDELVDRVLKAQEQRNAQASAKANAQSVVNRMTELYGSFEAAEKIVQARASELEVDVNYLMSTASQSPKAFFDLMKLETAPKPQAAPRNDINTAALASHAPGVKPGTPEFWEAEKTRLGLTAFYTPKIQQARMKDLQAYYRANN